MNLVQTRKCSFLIMEPNVKVNIDGSLLKKYANWDKPSCSVCTFFSRFEGTRVDKNQTAIPYRASTGTEQGFPYVVFMSWDPCNKNRFFLVRKTTQ